MKSNFDECLRLVLKSEGGFVNDPRDPGGITNHGCTKAVWEEWVCRPVTEQEMRNLTQKDVAPLFRKKYWDKILGDNLPLGIDYCVFDAAINSGPGRASKWLQACLKVEVDGVVGPATMKALMAANPKTFIEDYCQRRLSFMTELKTWEAFGRGWTKRVYAVKDSALAMTTL